MTVASRRGGQLGVQISDVRQVHRIGTEAVLARHLGVAFRAFAFLVVVVPGVVVPGVVFLTDAEERETGIASVAGGAGNPVGGLGIRGLVRRREFRGVHLQQPRRFSFGDVEDGGAHRDDVDRFAADGAGSHRPYAVLVQQPPELRGDDHGPQHVPACETTCGSTRTQCWA